MEYMVLWKRAGLDFNTTPPSVLNGGQIDTREGCASISNRSTGEILFYTDGTKVWDKNHQITPNGNALKGDYFRSVLYYCPKT